MQVYMKPGYGVHRFRQILKKIVDTKEGMGKKMRDSSFALTEAKYAAGEFRHTVFDSVETVPKSTNTWLSGCDLLDTASPCCCNNGCLSFRTSDLQTLLLNRPRSES